MSRASSRSYLSTPARSAWPGPRPGDPAAAQLARLIGGLVGHDVFPVGPVAVGDQHGDGRAQRLAGADAGEPLDLVALDLHPGARGRSPASGGRARGPPTPPMTGRPAGSPSTMVTRALPWDSPAVVNRSMQQLPRQSRSEIAAMITNEPGLRRARSVVTGRAADGSLRRGAVVDDPGRDQDDQVTPVLLVPAEAEQLADDRQPGQQRDARSGVGHLR